MRQSDAAQSLAQSALELMMSRGHNPLIWMMAVSLPTAGHALGLGEIHVDSALNEPLSAEIDIVGAAPEELNGLTASVANRDTFLHFGAERHNFLSSTTFKVSQDIHGRPVLAIRSTESFTEPLVDLVVDLRWRNGELIRQYTLLLDPAGFPSAVRNAQPLATPASRATMPAPVVSAPAAERAAQNGPVIPSPVVRRTPSAIAAATQPTDSVEQGQRKSIKVGAKATLRGIAWRVGARSRSDINRTMYAVFHANPDAFDGNINRMHLGALLTIPSQEEVAAIPQAEANREIRSQMSSWLSTWKGSSLASSHAAAAPAVSEAPAAPAAAVASPKAVVAPATASATPAAPSLAAPPTQAPANVTMLPAQQTNPAVPTAPVANGAKSIDDMNDAELNTRIKVLENSLREMQAQLESEHNKMLNIQAQSRYAEQHPAVAVQASTNASGSRGYMGMLVGGIAVLLGALGAFIVRSRRTPPSRPAIPVEPMGSDLGPEPVLTPKPVYAPVYTAQARAASKIEVTETPAEPDSLIELSRLEPSADLSAELGINHPNNADTAVINPGSLDSAGLDAARLRDDAVTARMREELEAAWSIPSAEQYQRHDETETTLAEAIEKSLADTARLRATQAQGIDMIDASETNENRALMDSTSTVVGPGETVVMEADTAKLPASTMAMHAEEIARAFEEPTVQQPRPDPNHIDFDLLNLDSGASPDLHGHVVAKGRSTPLDGLKAALERVPVDRPDVRMVLIETYFEQSVFNRQTFQDALETLNREHGLLTDDEWEKVNQMAKQIAA